MYCMQQREITIRSGKEGACSTWVSTRGAHVSARNSGDRWAVGVVKDCMTACIPPPFLCAMNISAKVEAYAS
jgi:hypothetical protein